MCVHTWPAEGVPLTHRRGCLHVCARFQQGLDHLEVAEISSNVEGGVATLHKHDTVEQQAQK